MKTKNKQNKTKYTTLIKVSLKDSTYLSKIARKMGLRGRGVVVEKMIKLMKDLKWENELK